MNNRNPFDPRGGMTPMVEQMLGNSYDTVRVVAMKLAPIEYVAKNMEQVDSVASNMPGLANINENMQELLAAAEKIENNEDLSAEFAERAEAAAVEAEGLVGNVAKAVLNYTTLVEAEAAAATLPDGQMVEDQAGQSEYKVSSGVLVIVKREAFNVFTQGAGRGDAAKDLEVFRRAAAKGGKIIVPAGEFSLQGGVAVKGNTDWEIHPDARILVKTGAGARDHAFYAKGAGLGEKSILSTDAAKFSDRLVVPNALLFSVGDWVLIGDDKVRTTSGPKSGEYQCIKAIEGNTIIFDEWLWSEYLVSRNAFVQKSTFAENIHFHGSGYIIGDQLGAVSTNGPLAFEYVKNYSTHGLNIEGFFKNGIYTSAALFGDVAQPNFRRLLDNTQGYGVVACNGTQWLTCERMYSHDASKIWDTGGESGLHGFNRFLTVRECAGYKAKRGAISTHPQCDFVTIENNDIYPKNDNNGGATGLANMYLRGGNISARNNRFHGSLRSAIHVQTLGHDGYIDIIGNKSAQATSHAIVVDTTRGEHSAALQGPPSRIRIEDNDAIAKDLTGIYVILGNSGVVDTLRITGNNSAGGNYAANIDVRSGGGVRNFVENGNTYTTASSVVRRVSVEAGASIETGSSAGNIINGTGANSLGIQEAGAGINNLAYTDNLINAPQATSGVPASRFGKNRHNAKVVCGDAWTLQANSFTRVASTGTTDEVTLATIPLQKRLIGNNGGIKVTALFTLGEATNTTKTVRAKLTGVTSGAVATSTTFYENSSVNKTVKAVRVQLEIWNNNNWASQRGGPIDLGFGNGGNQNLVFGSIDTREPFNVVLTGQIGDVADTVRLESYSVETIYQAT